MSTTDSILTEAHLAQTTYGAVENATGAHLHGNIHSQRLRLPGSRELQTHNRYPSASSVTSIEDRSLSESYVKSGSVTRLNLGVDDFSEGHARLEALRKERILGQFLASGLAGNAVLGSVFYALPPVVAISGIYSPLSLFIATLVLFMWRPIMEELASALPISGGPYTYILNVSSKTFALLGAALLLLDFAATSMVSAATAATYLTGELSESMPFPTWVGAFLILVLFILVSLTGVRESARIALAVFSLHIFSMIILIIASSIHWRNVGLTQLRDNWYLWRANTDTSSFGLAKQVFYGTSLGMLGLTGFECTPSYVARIKPGMFPLVLRNLHIPAIGLNTAVMILVLAILPMEVILGGSNILSILAQAAGGRWLRTWVATDAMIVLSGGVLTGILSACELFQQLALHRVVPQSFLVVIHRTGSPYVCIIAFSIFSGLLYATSGVSLSIISEVFSLVWLCVMSLFPISLLLLKYNRSRLPRQTSTSLTVVISTLIISTTIFFGNIAYKLETSLYFATYIACIMAFFLVVQNKVYFLSWTCWVYDRYPRLYQWRSGRVWNEKIVGALTSLQKQKTCLLVKTEELDALVRMISYVQKNEETSNIQIVHFYEEEKDIPSNLEMHVKFLNKVFPQISINLTLANGIFDPTSVAALSHSLCIPQALMFMRCPGQGCPYPFAEFGARIISL